MVFNTPQYINMAAVVPAPPVTMTDMDFETPKSIKARRWENADRAAEDKACLHVDCREAFRFFKDAQINYMKSIFKIYHSIEYVDVGQYIDADDNIHGGDTVVETPHKNNVRQRGPNAPNQAYTTDANYDRDRTHFMGLFQMMVGLEEVGFAEEY